MANKSKYGKRELEELWEKFGGPKAQAQIAAAIALAESKGVPTARNPEGPEHAEGLWQIKGQLVSGNPLNPEVSAANAVAKWKTPSGFNNWTTYTSGAYKKYLGEEEKELIPGESSIPVVGSVGKFLQEQGANLGKTAEEAVSPITSVASFLGALTKPSTWLRVAEGVGGIILFMVGLKTLTKGTPAAGATNVAIQQGRSVKRTVVKAAEAGAVIAK